jgi:hypothetical protein
MPPKTDAKGARKGVSDVVNVSTPPNVVKDGFIEPSYKQYGKIDHYGGNPRRLFKTRFTRDSLTSCLKSTEKVHKRWCAARLKASLPLADPPTGTQMLMLKEFGVEVPRDEISLMVGLTATRTWATNILAAKGIPREAPLWAIRTLMGKFKIPVTEIANMSSAVMIEKARLLQDENDAGTIVEEDLVWSQETSDGE